MLTYVKIFAIDSEKIKHGLINNYDIIQVFTVNVGWAMPTLPQYR